MVKTVKVRRSSVVIDLTCAGELTRRAIRDWMETGHSLDKKLLLECAYYPRGGCQDCTFTNPNPKCDKSHILKLEPPKHPGKVYNMHGEPIKPKPVVNKMTAWGKDLTSIWSTLPEDVKSQVMGVLKNET